MRKVASVKFKVSTALLFRGVAGLKPVYLRNILGDEYPISSR